VIVGAKHSVEIGGVLLKCEGAIEKLLGGNGEELGLVLRTVGVEKGIATLLGETAQTQEFAGADVRPFDNLVTSSEGGVPSAKPSSMSSLWANSW